MIQNFEINSKQIDKIKNISTEESNYLLNGGGLNCVLATAYQPKSDTTISGTKHKN